jgi:hypothetical protein
MSATIIRTTPADAGEVVTTYKPDERAYVALACARAVEEGVGSGGGVPGSSRGGVLYQAAIDFFSEDQTVYLNHGGSSAPGP